MKSFGHPALTLRKLKFISVPLTCFLIYFFVIKLYSSSVSLMMGNKSSDVRVIHGIARKYSQVSETVKYWNGKPFLPPFPGVDHYIEYSTQRYNSNSSTKRDFEPLFIDIKAYRYPISVSKCLSNQNIFVAIISAPSYFRKRETIRNTWLRHLNSSYGIAFVVGLTKNTTIQRRIEEENMEHGDIIQINFMDHYHNLTLKAVGLLNWISIHCPRISFLIKCDDDVYVNVPNFSDFLVNVSSKELALYGTFNYNPPERFADDKWFLSIEEWPWFNLPLFLPGGFIMVTGTAVRPLLDAARITPFLWLDDVYLSGLMAQKAGVNLYGSSSFFQIEDTLYEDPCWIQESISWITDSSQELIASHDAIVDLYFNNKSQC